MLHDSPIVAAPPRTSFVHPEEITVQTAAKFAVKPLNQDQTQATAFIHSGWARDRSRTYDALVRVHGPCSRIESFHGCGDQAWVYRCTDVPGLYKIVASWCHDRFCRPCGNHRGRTIAGNLLKHLQRRNLRFITLTLRSEPTDLSAHDDPNRLKATVDRLLVCFRKLRQSPAWRHHVSGGAAFLETKWQEHRSAWHTHLHLIVQGTYYSQKLLSNGWRHATGDSWIVDIRPCANHRHLTYYVTKYVSKPLHHSVLTRPDVLDQAITDLHRRRTCLTFGSWQGLELTKPLDNHTWECVGTLDRLIEDFRNGSDQAAEILDALNIHHGLELKPDNERSPPPTPPKPPAKTPELFPVW